jgi:hypothetical protein
MAYDLMILADPGPSRDAVLQVLNDDPRVSRDPDIETRFQLRTGQGGALISIGTKDPVESVHLETETDDAPLMEAGVRWALEFAGRLEMRVEDVHWGHEVTLVNLPDLRKHWAEQESESRRAGGATRGADAEPGRRPWWRLWS